MEKITLDQLKDLYPLNQHPIQVAEELLPTVRTRWYSSGRSLFNVGDSPDDYFYVLEGSVVLSDRDQQRGQTVGPVSQEEAIPMPYMVPSVHLAWAATDARILLIDRRQFLDVIQKAKSRRLSALAQSSAGGSADLWAADAAVSHPAPGTVPAPAINPGVRGPATAPAPISEEFERNLALGRAQIPEPPQTPMPAPDEPEQKPASEPPAADAPLHSEPGTAHMERILLVEDHPTDAKMAQLMLKTLGYGSDWVSGGPQALSAMERKRYQIVLLDVQLPGVDGFEITRCIRERWPGAAGPHIIALTARSLKGDREACLAAGMDDYIPKPISIHLLSAKLNDENWALVDPKVIEHFAMAVGKTGVTALIDSYLDAMPSMIADLHKAVAANNAKDLHLAAHSLKAAAQVLGVHLIAGYAAKLETLGRFAKLDGAPALLSQIDSVRQETVIELQKLRTLYG
ncbi:MAG: response regulator [Pseudomonadota bacterium]